MGLLSRIPPPKAVSCREAAAAACRETPSGVPRNPVRPHSGVPRSAPSCLWRRDARARHRSTRARREEEEEEVAAAVWPELPRDAHTRGKQWSSDVPPQQRQRRATTLVGSSSDEPGVWRRARVAGQCAARVAGQCAAWPGLRGGARVWRCACVSGQCPACVARPVWRCARVAACQCTACGKPWPARACLASARVWPARVSGVRAGQAYTRARRPRAYGPPACRAYVRVWRMRVPGIHARV